MAAILSNSNGAVSCSDSDINNVRTYDLPTAYDGARWECDLKNGTCVSAILFCL